MITFDEFLFKAQVLGFDLKNILIEDKLCIYGFEVQQYIFQHNPIFPENLIINVDWDDSIDLIEYDKVLPRGLTVYGGVDLFSKDTKNPVLPEEMTVYGDLDISMSYISTIPKSLKVYGSIDIVDTNVIKFPDDYIIQGSLYYDNELHCDNKFIIMKDVHCVTRDQPKHNLPENVTVLGVYHK